MSRKGHDLGVVEGTVRRSKEKVRMTTLDVFDMFSRDYAREKFETM